jgi:hypothetical protein
LGSSPRAPRALDASQLWPRPQAARVHGGSLTARHQMPSLVGQRAPDASVGPAPRPHRNLAKILGARGSARPIAPGSSPVRRRRGFDSTTCWARARLSAVDVLSTGIVIGIVVVALAATLGASEVLVRGVGRLARNLGLLAGVVGLIVALGADSPEISSSVSAVASGSAATLLASSSARTSSTSLSCSVVLRSPLVRCGSAGQSLCSTPGSPSL